MLRSNIRLVGLALIPAAILVSHSSLGEAKGDECKAKPDSSAPAGLHWYYRVDRANNRHCWYLHQQGMRVHSLISATSSRNPDIRNDTADEQIWKTPPVTDSPKPDYQQSARMAERPAADFAARWVDLPKPVDLNTHEPVSESIGYAAEPGLENKQEQLPLAWANASVANAEPQHDAAEKPNFGSVSLAGAVLLALLLMSEVLVPLARRSARSLLRLRLRAGPRRGIEHSHATVTVEAARDAPAWRGAAGVEPLPRTETGMNDLRCLLQRAGTGLRPAQSFAPSRPAHHHEGANRARAQSAFERLKSRSFSGMTWAPL